MNERYVGRQKTGSLPSLSLTDFTNLKMSDLICAVQKQNKTKKDPASQRWVCVSVPCDGSLLIVLWSRFCLFMFAVRFLERAVKDIITAVTLTSAINCALCTVTGALTLSLTNYIEEFKLDHLNNDKAVKTEM